MQETTATTTNIVPANRVLSAWAGISQTTSSSIFIDATFDINNPDESLAKIKAFLPQFIAAKNDEGIKELIMVANALFAKKFTSPQRLWSEQAIATKDFLINVYLSFPAQEEPARRTSFLASKCLILQIIGKTWSKTLRPENKDIFRFFASVYAARKEKDPAETLFSYEIDMVGRYVDPKEQSEIENILRERIKEERFEADYVKAWIEFARDPEEPFCSDDLIRIFELSWVRQGGNVCRLFEESAELAHLKLQRQIEKNLSVRDEKNGWHLWITAEKKEGKWHIAPYLYPCLTNSRPYRPIHEEIKNMKTQVDILRHSWGLEADDIVFTPSFTGTISV